MITEAIVLAGGFGTRLKEAVPDLPKCMAPIKGKPFIHYLIEHYLSNGITRFILSLGYRSDIIRSYCDQHFSSLDMEFVIEEEPLGTGGAIVLSARHAKSKDIIVLNGDTFYNIDVAHFSNVHKELSKECTIALKPMMNFDRYGVVQLNKQGIITSFAEKKFYEEGLINGGVYAIHVEDLLEHHLPAKFSFEKDYLEQFCFKGKIAGCIQDGYFIDIGIPADYQRAQIELPVELQK